MGIIGQLAAADAALPWAEIGAFAAPLLVILAIGWSVQLLEDRLESSATPARSTEGLAIPHEMVSPRRAYALGRRIAVGDVCDVNVAVGDDAEWVLKIARRSDAEPLLLREHRVLRQLADRSEGSPYRLYLPEAEETFSTQRRRVNVYRRREGLFTAEEIRRQFPEGLDGRHLAWMFNRTLEVIGFAHTNDWIHGAVLPPHLMFHAAEHGLQLVGWIHAERRGQPLRTTSRRYRDWYPPECRRRRPARPSLDIYLAATSMIWLAGGDPRSHRMPEHVPTEIRRFLRSCVLESPRMRPQDAWELHEEFTDLLEGVYGPPKFHVLDMKGESHGNHSMV
jgi:hypothetical protein